MCNLYSVTSNHEAIRAWAGVMAENDSTGNMQPMPGVFPDYAAPIVRNQGGVRGLALSRWGMPTPPKYVKRHRGNRPGDQVPHACDADLSQCRELPAATLRLGSRNK
jgi:putative SOS response-associated peptidase YedK